MRSSGCAIAAVCFLSCGGSSSPPPPEAWAASAKTGDGDDVSIAVVIEGDRLRGFVCADDPVSDRYPGWFSGAADADGVFRLEHDGWKLVASTSDVRLVSPAGELTHWVRPAEHAAGLTGLYAADDSGCTTGVIVLDDGSAPPLVRGAWCDGFGRIAQVTPAIPVAVVEDRLAVEVVLPAERRRLFVAPVRSASP